MVLQACLTFKIQRGIISMFYSKCVSGLQAHSSEAATYTTYTVLLASLVSRSQVSLGTTSPLACPHVRPSTSSHPSDYVLPTLTLIPSCIDAAIFYLSTQLTSILSYFLSRNMRVARERIYAQTVASRGKGPDFWGPYVEEWADPPKMRMGSDGKAVRKGMSAKVARMMSTFVGRVVLKNGEDIPRYSYFRYKWD
jgi:hypothetical protein